MSRNTDAKLEKLFRRLNAVKKRPSICARYQNLPIDTVDYMEKQLQNHGYKVVVRCKDYENNLIKKIELHITWENDI